MNCPLFSLATKLTPVIGSAYGLDAMMATVLAWSLAPEITPVMNLLTNQQVKRGQSYQACLL